MTLFASDRVFPNCFVSDSLESSREAPESAAWPILLAAPALSLIHIYTYITACYRTVIPHPHPRINGLRKCQPNMLDCKAIGTPSKDIIGPKTGQVSAQPGTKTGHLQPKPGIKIRQVPAKPGPRIDHLSPNSVKKPPFMFSQRPYWPQNRPPSAQTWYENPPGFSPVSYTHLDVYKRQLLQWRKTRNSPGEQGRCFPVRI